VIKKKSTTIKCTGKEEGLRRILVEFVYSDVSFVEIFREFFEAVLKKCEDAGLNRGRTGAAWLHFSEASSMASTWR
jgi:hypothetical protein